MKRKVVGAGDSSAVTIPLAFQEILKIKKGDTVDVTMSLDGKIIISPIEEKKIN